MITSNELKQRHRFQGDVVHSSDLTGKVRIIKFTAVADAAGETKVLIAKLPAGRGRFLPFLSRMATSAAGSLRLMHGAYKSTVMAEGEVAEAVIAPAASVNANTVATWSTADTVQGWEYHSLEDVDIFLVADAAIAAGTTFKGLIFYNKE